MAILIPSLNSCLNRMQAGERRFARRLESHLEEDYLCWYEMPVGSRQRYSDFIVLHPGRGLLLLEVKDWKLDTIRSIDKVSASILTSSGLKQVANPLEQARQCAYQLVRRLEADQQLVLLSGPHQGKLCFPYGYGVVLSNITRRELIASGMAELLPERQVICRDEMTESVDPEDFQKRLWDMFNYNFDRRMTLPQIDRVRWHIFPEVRIHAGQTALFHDVESGADGASLSAGQDVEIPDIVRVMDMQQEQLARSLGEGHRVIHGVAGSGKTLILGYRCLYLAKLLHKPILVICFNITLASWLRGMMIERGVNDRVHVYHFHDWCGEQLRRYHIAQPAFSEGADAKVAAVIAAVDQGSIPRGQYGALLVDEGHDFEESWLRLIVQMVDPDEGSLLLLYDDAQSIYKSKKSIDFSLSSVGIKARGRTTILKLNYRNTRDILDYAYRFIRNYLAPSDSDDDHVPLIEPQASGRRGPPPYLRLCGSRREEILYVAHTLSRLNSEGMAWREMCVTCRSKGLAEALARGLGTAGIPVDSLITAAEKKSFDRTNDAVKVMTMHSSKGLEFPLVVIPGLGELPIPANDAAVEAKLLYVAMTRSTDKLLLTASRKSAFVDLLRASGDAVS